MRHVLAVGPLAIASIQVDSASSSFPKERLADGSLSTQWVNGGYQAATSWAAVGLSASASLSAIAIKTGPSPAGTRFDLQVSADGTTWTTTIAGLTNSTWNMETKALPAGTTGRFVRVLWHNSTTSPQAHFAIYELSVSGTLGATTAGSPTPVPTATPTPTPTATPVSSGTFPSAATAASAYAAHKSLLGSGLRGPNGLAKDASDSLYEADWNGNTVTKVTQSGVCTRYASSFSGPAGLAFDPAGNLLVAVYNGGTLDKIPPGGGSHTHLVSSGLNKPVWPAVNSHGIIFLADYANNRIARITPDGQVSTFVSMSSVNAIDIDPQDNLWVTTWGGRVAKITPQGQVTNLVSGLSTACAIAWCPNYLAVGLYGGQNQHNGRLLLVDFAGKQYPVDSGLDRTSSVIFDSKGAVYTANVGDTALRKYALH
jgi:sugar lactone lactonase YvrE